jgi:hypothetical protein
MAPKARQPRWQIAPCAQHAVAFLVVIPKGDLRLLLSFRIEHTPPSSKTPTSSASPENKVQNRVTFFASQNSPSKTPHPPRIPPRSHHQKTTSKHR